jgi:hypothetical protein
MTGAAGFTAWSVQEQQATEMNTAEIDLGRTVVGLAEKRREISTCGRRALLYICKEAAALRLRFRHRWRKL